MTRRYRPTFVNTLKVLAWVLVPFLLLGSYALFDGQSRPRAIPHQAISTSHFHVPAKDRVHNRVGLLEGLLFITFLKTEVLNPEGRPGTTLPIGAIIRAGTLSLRNYTTPGSRRLCDGILADDIRHSYLAGNVLYRPFLESALYADKKDQHHYQYFVATDQAWVAQCWPAAGSCTTLFSNGKWAARINISQRDLCNAPRMNRRLVAIADKWIK